MDVASDLGFEVLRMRVQRLTGLDLNAYRSHQMERRLLAFLKRHGLADYMALGRALDTSREMLQEFRDYLTINVSEFYRNGEKFQELQERILPELLRRRDKLRVWSAGCSHGAEIYTVVMLLEELTPGRSHSFLASDIDRSSLDKARTAVYAQQDLGSLPDRFRDRHFKQADAGWQLDRRLASRVEFTYHNMLEEPMPKDLDLILCRNVVIYFTEEAKGKLYRRFYESLVEGGVLFTGGTETIFLAREIGFQLRTPCFYQKGETGLAKAPGWGTQRSGATPTASVSKI